MWLPDRCANVAIYILLCIEPIELHIDKKILTLFGQFIRDKETLEYSIAERQIAIYSVNDRSWFSKLKTILFKYNLPQANTLLENSPTKQLWKKLVDEKTKTYWENHFTKEKENKSSLRLLSTNDYQIGNCHQIFKFTLPDPLEVEKSAVKARIITGSYLLQSNRSKFNQHDVMIQLVHCANKNLKIGNTSF